MSPAFDETGVPVGWVEVELLAGKDAADHLAAGNGLKDFALVDAETPVRRFVDWSDFWSKDRSSPEWLFDDVLARGRGHAIYAKHGTGKSLFALWLSTELVKAGHVVVYGDWEMGEDDLFDRLSDMGHGPETDLSRLRYLLLPNLPPLNSAEGAQELGAILDEVEAAWPECHLAVVIDTIGRAVVGEENSNDTILGFYRHTGMELRRRGVTWVRLDHAGHEGTHARGGSAKGDDVDVVWQLAPIDDGIELRADKRRMSWVPEKVALSLVTDPVLKYVPVAQSWLAGTREAVEALDRLGVPLDTFTRAAEKALKDAGEGRRAQIVRAALRYRKMLENGRDAHPDALTVAKAGRATGRASEIPHSYGQDAHPDAPGRASAESVGRAASLYKGRGVPAPDLVKEIERCEACAEAVCRCEADGHVEHDEVARWEGMAEVQGNGSVDEPAGAKEPGMAPKHRTAIEILEDRYAAEDAAATVPLATSGAK